MQSSQPASDRQVLLTIPQAAQRLSISRALLYALIARKKGPPVIHLGRAVRIPAASLHKWVEEQEQEQRSS